MKRFVDIRGQNTGYRFCFLDTGVDKIETFASNNVWDTFAEFELDLRTEFSALDMPGVEEAVTRYKNLTPDWAMKEAKVESSLPFAYYRDLPKEKVNLTSFISMLLDVTEIAAMDIDDFTIEIERGQFKLVLL